MAETIAQEQKKTKPALEHMIAANLDADLGQNALAFLEYCKRKKVSYLWHSTNCWNLTTKGKCIGSIYLGGVRTASRCGDNAWFIQADLRGLLQYDDFIAEEGITDFILKNVTRCVKCDAACKKTFTATILGKDFKNVCNDGMGIRCKNPDVETVRNIQRVLDYRLALPCGTANRPIFDPAAGGLVRVDNKLRVQWVTDLDGVSDENMDNLFDGKYNRYYNVKPYGQLKAKEGIHDVIIGLDAPAEVKMYSLVTGMRFDVPRRWTLYGSASKDGAWTQLDVRDEFPAPIAHYAEKAFPIDAPKAYQYYRFTFEGRFFMLSQVHLYTC